MNRLRLKKKRNELFETSKVELNNLSNYCLRNFTNLGSEVNFSVKKLRWWCMTLKIDKSQFLRDFREGKTYTEIAFLHKSSLGSVAYRVKKLGLRRNRQKRELFSKEEKDFMRAMLNSYRGRRQLLNILRGK